MKIVEFEIDDGGAITPTGYRPAPILNEDIHPELVDCWTAREELADAALRHWEITKLTEDEYCWQKEAFEDEYELLEPEERNRGVGKERVRLLQQFMKYGPELDAPAEWILEIDEEMLESLQDRVRDWLTEAPNPLMIDAESIPDSLSGQGLALQYFRDEVSEDARNAVGVRIVEGECPGSSFFAAELKVTVERANKAAEKMRLPFRFTKGE